MPLVTKYGVDVWVLVVEDENRLAAGLKKGLRAEGFAADVALTGPDRAPSFCRNVRFISFGG
jgi:DNA-binding response OmpR family regulator